MTICDSGHEEICYVGGKYDCPACILLREVEELTKERDALQAEKDNHVCEV